VWYSILYKRNIMPALPAMPSTRSVFLMRPANDSAKRIKLQ
jgi:hypothetical protein